MNLRPSELKVMETKVVGTKVKVMATFGQDNFQSLQQIAMTSFGLGNQRLFELKVMSINSGHNDRRHIQKCFYCYS